MTEPYIPFYKPYGMSDEEYAHEIDIAHRKHEEWALENQQIDVMGSIHQLKKNNERLARYFTN